MIDYTKYTWLDSSKRYTADKEQQTKRVLEALDKQNNLADAKKNILAQYYFYRLDDAAFAVEPDIDKMIRHWRKSKRFHKMQTRYRKDEEAQYTMSGIVMVITGTLFLFFLTAVLRQRFVVAFSVDAIVGAIALAMLIRNVLLKYTLVRRYTTDRTYLYMDVLAAVICLLLKVVIPPNLDFSLIVLFADYILAKRRFYQQLVTVFNK